MASDRSKQIDLEEVATACEPIKEHVNPRSPDDDQLLANPDVDARFHVNIGDGTLPKGKAEALFRRSTPRSSKRALQIARFPGTMATERGVKMEVHFHVIMSSTPDFNPDKDMAIVWCDALTIGRPRNHFDLIMKKRLDDESILFHGIVKGVKVELAETDMHYRYGVLKGNDDIIWEYHAGKKDDNSPYRTINMMKKYCKAGGIWNQYDDIMYQKKVPNKRLVNQDRQKFKAAMIMLPDWESLAPEKGDSKKMLAVDFLRHIEQFKHNASQHPVEKKRFDIQELLKGYLLSPQAKQIQSKQVIGLTIGMVRAFLVSNYNLDVNVEELRQTFDTLCIQPDIEKQACHDYHLLCKNFPPESDERMMLPQVLNDLIRLGREKERDLNWLLCIPLLHFLRGDSIPFEETKRIDTDPDIYGDKWWGISGLNVERNSVKKLKRIPMEKLHNILLADRLLERVILYVLEVGQYPAILTTGGRVSPSTVMFALKYTVVDQLARDDHANSSVLALKNFLHIGNKQHVSDEVFLSAVDALIRQESGRCANMPLLHINRSISIDVITSVGAAKQLFEYTWKNHTLLIAVSRLFATCHSLLQALETRVNKEGRKGYNIGDYLNREVVDTLENSFRKSIDIAISWLKLNLPHRMVSGDSPGYQVSSNIEMEVWNGLMNTGESFVIAKYKDRWCTNIARKFKNRLNKLNNTQRMELYCYGNPSVHHKDIQEIIRGEALQAMEEVQLEDKRMATVVNAVYKGIEQNNTFEMNVIGEILSQFLKNSRPHQLPVEEAILSHILTWTPFPEFLQLAGTNRFVSIQFDEDAKLYYKQLQATYEETRESLTDGTIFIKDLRLVLKHRERFADLCRAQRRKTKVPKKVNTLLDARVAELKQLDDIFRFTGSFLNICSQINPVALGDLAKSYTAFDTFRLNKLCPPNTSRNGGKASPRILFSDSLTPTLLTVLKDVHVYEHSHLFSDHWIKAASEVRAQLQKQQLPLTLEEIETHVWPTVQEKMKDLFLRVKRGKIVLAEVDESFARFENDDKALEDELILIGKVHEPSTSWIKKTTKQIKLYHELGHVREAANAVSRVKQTFALEGNFKKLATKQNEDFKGTELRAVDEKMVKASKLLKKMTTSQIESLNAFCECQDLIYWVRNNMRDNSELLTFIDLASISAGETDIEVDRVKCFHQATTGYSSLIYDIRQKTDFEGLIKACGPVWKRLETDPVLPKKLLDTKCNLGWLKTVKDQHGSVESSSLSQVIAINQRGIFKVGSTSNASTMQTINNIIQLHLMVGVTSNTEQIESDESIVYDWETLNELQSKLMLVVGRNQQGKEDVDRFIEVMDGILRLATNYMKLNEAGCDVLSRWIAEIHNGKDMVKLDFGSKEHILGSSIGIIAQLRKLSNFLEESLKEWQDHVETLRSEYTFLNYYTVEQILYLRMELGNILRYGKTADRMVFDLLSVVFPSCSQTILESVLESRGLTQSHESDRSDIIQAIFHSGRELVESLCYLWTQHLTQSFRLESTNILSIQHLGHILEHLGWSELVQVNRPLPEQLKEGKPTLIVCPKDEALHTVLSIYMEGPQCGLPSSDEVLLCTRDTTLEQVILLFRRAMRDETGKIYCLIYVEELDYEVSVRAEEERQKLMALTSNKYRLVIVCSSEGEDRSYMTTALDHFRTDKITTCNIEETKAYLEQQFKAEVSAVPDIVVAAGSLTTTRSSVQAILSTRSGVGKSLSVQRLAEKLVNEQDGCVTIPVHSRRVDQSHIVEAMQSVTIDHDNPSPKIFHFDISPIARDGLDKFLFNLLVLRVIEDSRGNVWRRYPWHLYIIETTDQHFEDAMLKSDTLSRSARRSIRGGSIDRECYFHTLLPVLKCQSPLELLQAHEHTGHKGNVVIDIGEYQSAHIQRTYQYLTRYATGQDLDRFSFHGDVLPNESTEHCLGTLMAYCGMTDPSWREMRHFTGFLNEQLKSCEDSVYCNIANLGQTGLDGFRLFVVKFMIAMSTDFSTPSIQISDSSQSVCGDGEDSIVEQFLHRRKWETSPHPYLFFNREGGTMTFLGFNIDEGGNLLDPINDDIIMENVIKPNLRDALVMQMVNFNESANCQTRDDFLLKLSRVMGAKEDFDPDSSFELTMDNVKKMMAIQMRFRCDIPVVVIGETGCGKTRLVRFMCELQAGPGTAESPKPQNMVIMKVHGGTTADDIIRKVEQAQIIAEQNRQQYNLDTVLFFDEANTTEMVGLIKEIMCDVRMNGQNLQTNQNALKIIAACNPYRKHKPEMIERLESAGLGYHVKTGETGDSLGRIPMRHLVYRVQPLPPSMLTLVWDFGQLSREVEGQYISQIVRRYANVCNLYADTIRAMAEILTASQEFMRKTENECSFVSLRDVERVMDVFEWFYVHDWLISPLIQKKAKEQFERERKTYKPVDKVTRALILALGVCYHSCLQTERQHFREEISRHFVEPFTLPNGSEQFLHEINWCQDVFLDNMSLAPNIARNLALKENVMLMVVCIELRIPLFLVGKPGSSKSLAKTVVADAMQGERSKSRLFQELKEVHMVSFQCSPLSTTEGIVGTFRQCSRFQQGKDLTSFVSVVVLDEIGLAEDSPKMPLKALHPLLDYGCDDDDNPSPDKKVAFIGISNWALDPAKMNRGILVSRASPDKEELIESARGICSSHGSGMILSLVQPIFSALASAYLEIYTNQEREFFGLRDFYSLVKMVYAFCRRSRHKPTWSQLEHAIRRNFGGLDNLHVVDIYAEHLKHIVPHVKATDHDDDCSPAALITASIYGHGRELQCESRYLLILAQNFGALSIIQHQLLRRQNQDAEPVVIFGSSFPKDQEYTQVCRNINRIKVCMETGRMVVLLNLENLYESLYDALNQYYSYFGGQRYVDLGLGTHRVKCRVHQDFRLIVVADKQHVYEKFPIPLINRLEKHFLAMTTLLTPEQSGIVDRLQKWVTDFSEITMVVGSKRRSYSVGECFIGFNEDTLASIVLEVLSETKFEKKKQSYDVEDVVMRAKEKLLLFATPDAVARLPFTRFSTRAKEYWAIYFGKQKHDNFAEFLRNQLDRQQASNEMDPTLLQIITHYKLLVNSDLHVIADTLRLQKEDVKCIYLQEFQTEQQYSKTLRQFFNDRSPREKVMIVQCESGHEYSNLIACAQYVIQDELSQAMENATRNNTPFIPTHVVFIIQLPRGRKTIRSYSGYQGGRWISAYVDDVRQEPFKMSSLIGFFKKSIGDIFAANVQLKEGQDKFFNVNELIRGSLPYVVAMLHDEGTDHKCTQRLQSLVHLINQENPEGSFMDVVFKRLYILLKQRDEHIEMTGGDPTTWMFKEAAGTDLHAVGTFRRTLWRRLRSTVVPILAQIVALTDRGNCLELLRQCGDKTWQYILGMSVLGNTKISDFTYQSLMSSSAGQQPCVVRVEPFVSNCQQTYSCRCPFSWLIKSLYDEILATETDMKVDRFIRLTNDLPITLLLREVEGSGGTDVLRSYLHDFVLLVYGSTYSEQYHEAIVNVINKATIEERVTLNQSGYEIPTVLLIHLAYNRLKPRLENYLGLLTLFTEEGRVRALRSTEDAGKDIDLVTLHLLLEHLKPIKEDLHDNRRLTWLNRLHKARAVIGRVLSGNRQYCFAWVKLQTLQLFIEHIYPPDDKHDDEVVSRQCHQLLEELGDKVDFKKLQCIETLEKFLRNCKDDTNKRVFKYGDHECAICFENIEEPVCFPCQHVFCLSCASKVCGANTLTNCPTCNTEIPATFRPIVSEEQRSAVLQHHSYRNRLNSFYMDIVSRFVFAGDTAPEQELIQRLLSHVTHVSKRKGVLQTKRFTVFGQDGVDDNPVIRTFLLQLLLKNQSSNLQIHLQDYLKHAKEVIHSDTEVIDLCTLVICCMEDMHHRSTSRRRGLITQIAKATEFLKNACSASRGLGMGETIDMNVLDMIAKVRYAMHVVGDQLHHTCVENTSPVRMDAKEEHVFELFSVAETLCEKEWPQSKTYLIQYLLRRFGLDVFQTVTRDPIFGWIMPDFDSTEEDSSLDPFSIHSDEYLTLRDSLSEALLLGTVNNITRTFQALTSPRENADAMLLLALYQEITLQCNVPKEPSLADQITQAVIDRLHPDNKVLATKLSDNQQGGHCSYVNVTPNQSPIQISMAKLIVHFMVVLRCKKSSNLLGPLLLLIDQPERMNMAYFPTMPEDHFSEAMEAMPATLRWYKCPNGHPYAIGECGKPWQKARCAECGSEIGGERHSLVQGNVNVTGARHDNTRTGHILGPASRRSDTIGGERSMSPMVTAIMRLILHVTMIISSSNNPQLLENVIHPTVRGLEIPEFLKEHVKFDIQSLCKSTGKSSDEVFLMLHLVIQRILNDSSSGRGRGSTYYKALETKVLRKEWEDAFSNVYVKPVLKGLSQQLLDASEQINKHSNNPFLKLLDVADPPISTQKVQNIHRLPTVWRYRPRVSMEDLKHVVEEVTTSKDERENLELLLQFVREEHRLRMIKYLLGVIELQQLLIQDYNLNIDVKEARRISIGEFIMKRPTGHQREHVKWLVQNFIEVWNLARENIRGNHQLSEELVLQDLTETSKLITFLPVKKKDDSCCLALTRFLVRTHNDFMLKYINIKQDENIHPGIQPNLLKESDVITFDIDDDLLPVIYSHANYSLKMGKGMSVEYELRALQKHIEDRFLRGKPLILEDFDIFTFRQDFRNAEKFDKLKKRVHQEKLSRAPQHQILSDIRSFTDICDLLACLDIAIGFVASTGGNGDVMIGSYLNDTLDFGTDNFKLTQECRLKHILSLWQLLAVERDRGFILVNQDPFETLSKDYRQELTDDLTTCLVAGLRQINVDSLVQQLHEFIVLKLMISSDDEELDMRSDWGIRDTLQAYLEAKDEEILGFDEYFPEDITLGNIWYTWREIVTINQQYIYDQY
ncbi:E3 ubiquitin-protein ligase rnf213-alpha-like [Glandiceps talaboti]